MAELDGLSILLKQVEEQVAKRVDNKAQKVVSELKDKIEDLKKYQPMMVVKDGVKAQVKGLRHKQLKDLINLTASNHNLMIVGSAGSGKTKAAEQTAEALGLKFYCQSVGAQTSKSDLLGYMDANGKYVSSLFREAYEKGGVFVMDEIDAGNSNVLIVLNSALSSNLCSFPDGMIERHEDFRFVSTANTYGNGSNRQYVGRNQLDSATLDRFTVLDWQIDTNLEKAMVAAYQYGQAWQHAVEGLRDYVERNGIRAVVSPRMTMKGAAVLELGMSRKDAVDMVVLPQIPADRASRVADKFRQLYEEGLTKYPPKPVVEAAGEETDKKKTRKASTKKETATEPVTTEEFAFEEVPF